MGEPKPDETEDLTAEDRTVGELLHGLKRVDAPASFDAQVKARIADGEPKGSSGWAGFPVPVYVISLGAVLVIGSLFVLREFYWAGNQDIPVVAGDKRTPSTNAVGVVNFQQQVPPSNSLGTPASNTEVAGPPANGPLFNKQNPDRLPPGGSVVQGQGNAEQPVPRGFDVNTPRIQGPNPGGTHVPITDFLSALGITAGFQGQALKVSAIGNGSVADKSGIKAGDIIEAIGDQKLTGPNTAFGARIEAKTITVNRGGQTIQIKITTH